ncbi:hypothetical protein PHYBOEH_007000 [Phytophthora boehmeriae]|uniref:TRAF-type domain-containing protein n=1 Tax=Phytophthora boehmeriae TaxID=109152 RepID=A0A8T1X467_9STRA|nr:hypothetical protein PHYBOEH_007000 [Phytophthora boehmeriae]
MSSATKQLADDFNNAESGLMETRKAIALARGWIEINIFEAKRILDMDVSDESSRQAVRDAIAGQAAKILQENLLLAQLLPEVDRLQLSDLEVWSKHVGSERPTAKPNVERQRMALEQNKLLKKRSEYQALLEVLDPDDTETPRLQQRYEREIAKVDAKLALMSENKPTQLLERCGHHIVASSSKNVISLVAGPEGEITFYRPSGSKAAREVNFQTRLERNRWNHVVFSASAKETNLFLNGEFKSVRRGVFDLPMSRIGSNESPDSFQGYIQEIRYWKECRTMQQIQQHAASILHIAKCKKLIGYWTLEEGMGELIDDMSLKLPRSACFNTDWVIYGTPEVRKRFGVPPTPSLRDQTCCVVNQKLKLLAQRARDRELDMVPCRQNCEQIIAFRLLERHHRVECVNRMVVCKEVGCGELYRFANETEHLRFKCERRLYREKLVQSYHEKREMIECILNCEQLVQKRLMTQHCHHECTNRLTTCPWEDCKATVIAKKLDSHLAKECQSEVRESNRLMVENSRTRQVLKAAIELVTTKDSRGKTH